MYTEYQGVREKAVTSLDKYIDAGWFCGGSKRERREVREQVLHFLEGVGALRAVATEIMCIADAGLTVDLLLSVANEARMLKTKRASEADFDNELFRSCEDDKTVHALVANWMVRKKFG